MINLRTQHPRYSFALELLSSIPPEPARKEITSPRKSFGCPTNRVVVDALNALPRFCGIHYYGGKKQPKWVCITREHSAGTKALGEDYWKQVYGADGKD